MAKLSAARMALLLVGSFVWLPYLYIKYGTGQPVAPLPFLAVHIPCMAGALAIRVWQYKKKKAAGCR